jgi:hypothetical protein
VFREKATNGWQHLFKQPVRPFVKPGIPIFFRCEYQGGINSFSTFNDPRLLKAPICPPISGVDENLARLAEEVKIVHWVRIIRLSTRTPLRFTQLSRKLTLH